MAQLHTLIISTKYRPESDGLSDYVFFFFNQLRKNNLPINLVTSSDERIRQFARDDRDVYPIIDHWDFLGPLKLLKHIRKKNPQYILIEYVPQMYGRAGLNFFFPFYVFIISFILRKKVILRAHELHYPFQKSIKTAILFSWHIWNLFWLSLSSYKILTTTEKFIKILKRFPLADKKIYLLPVGPNIRRMPKLISKTNEKRLILFGSLHPAKETPLVLNYVCDYFKNNSAHPFTLHIIGPGKEEVLENMHMINESDRHYLLDKTFFHGQLSEEDVATCFSEGHFALNYFVDGLSGRRGSAISALNSGLPLLASFRERSDSIFFNRPMIFFTDGSREEFHQCLKKMESISDSDYEQLRLKALHFVDENFSWEKIGQSYLDYLKD